MIKRALSELGKLDQVGNSSTAATSTVNSSSVDMAGYENALFFGRFGTPAANNTIKIQQSDDNGGSDDWTDLAGSQVVPGASDENVYVDVIRATKRYVRAVFLRGTSTTLSDLWCVRYGARNLPVNNRIAGTCAGKIIGSAAEGTA